MYYINVELIKGRKWVKRAMISTMGINGVSSKEELEKRLKWKLTNKRLIGLLCAKHSPIEEMEFWVDMVVPERVHTHLIRHEEIGKYVATSRPDLLHKTELKDGMRILSLKINAKRLIEISEQRLCNRAWKETRHIWEEVVGQCIDIEPILSYVLMKPCEKYGYCIETDNWCGYDYSGTYELHRQDMEKLKKKGIK